VDGRVRLILLGDIDLSATELALRQAAITIVPSDSDADLSVVLCADYLDPRPADIDAEHRAVDQPWLLAKPVGTQPRIGPVLQSTNPM
jgi:ribosomal protein S12 methylthiotransferase accessory factor